MNTGTAAVNDSMPGGAYAARVAVDAATLTNIWHANAAFLALVAERRASAGGGPVYGLGAELAARVPAAGIAAERVAQCHYTLFNLRFEDAGFWSAALHGAAPTADAAPGSPMEAAFVRTAVFLAWHLAQRNELAAAIVLGMTPEVQQAWRALPLAKLERAAPCAHVHLQARWGGHARFWPKLLDAARGTALDQSEHVRLLGLQLLAADGVRTQLPQLGRRSRRPGQA